MKVLWLGDAVIETGFGRVTHAICDRLHALGHEVAIMGVNYQGDPHPHPYRIYPCRTDTFGYQRIGELILAEKPDVVVVFNDIWVAKDYLNIFQQVQPHHQFKTVSYFPVDGHGLYPFTAQQMNGFDRLINYTQFGKEVAEKAGMKSVDILPHGIDLTKFKPIPQKEARKRLGVPADKFIVLNANRNQPRKHIDLTVRGFIEFAKTKENALLHLHMGTKDMGWDLIPLFNERCIAAGLNPQHRLSLSNNNPNIQQVSIEDLNLIYAASDVNINTCEGEGWGLTAMETAACKIPQIQPDHTACKELWGDCGKLIPVKLWKDDPNYGLVRGYVDPKALAFHLIELANNPKLLKQLGEAAYEKVTRPEYNWDNITARLVEILEETIKG